MELLLLPLAGPGSHWTVDAQGRSSGLLFLAPMLQGQEIFVLPCLTHDPLVYVPGMPSANPHSPQGSHPQDQRPITRLPLT